jgi:hypothetical protein
MQVHQGQQCQDTSAMAQTCLDGDNNASATTVTMPMRREGKEVSTIRTTTPAQQERQHPCNVGNGASAMKATMPLWQTMPLWCGQWHQLNDSNNAMVMRAKTLLQQWQRRLDCKDAHTLTMATPLQLGQQCQLNDSKDACSLMMATTPLLQGQQCQLNDYASSTAAETPWQRVQQLPSQQLQRCLRIKGNNAIMTRAIMPLQWWWGCLHINDDDNAIMTRAMMPAWGRQQCHHDKGKNAIADQGQQRHCYKGDDAILMTARMPAYRQWQQCHCYEGNNCNCNNSEDACISMATTPSWQMQQCQLEDKQQGRWRCISNGDNTIMTRATIAIATTAKMPVHWWQRCQFDNEWWGQTLMMTMMRLQQGQQCQLEDGNNGIMTRATMPSWIKGNNAIVTRVMMPSWQWQGPLCINNGNNAIVMRVTIAIMTTVKMPAHWQQTRPLQQLQQCQLEDEQQGQQG